MTTLLLILSSAFIRKHQDFSFTQLKIKTGKSIKAILLAVILANGIIISGCSNMLEDYSDNPDINQGLNIVLQNKSSIMPADIIFIIDNSGSMGGEILAVVNNINQNFAEIINNSGIDYRIILISRHGEILGPESICVEAPLSGILQGGCSPAPPMPVNNPPYFYHYSVEVGSLNSWCKIISTFYSPDEFNLAPNGWSEWLRNDSLKVFVMITDDDINCTLGGYTVNDLNTAEGGQQAALDFDLALRTVSPQHFGTEEERNYMYYSIVGMEPNTPEELPWLPSDPITVNQCSPGSAGPGTGHQALSNLTGGLRFPSCLNVNFDIMFNDIADTLVERLECQFSMSDIETALSNIWLNFYPGNDQVEKWTNVADKNSCTGLEWYFDNNISPSKIHLCPDACSKFNSSTNGSINLRSY